MAGTTRGYAGIGTSGAPNTKSVISTRNIAGSEPNRYIARNPGIIIQKRKRVRKTRVKLAI